MSRTYAEALTKAKTQATFDPHWASATEHPRDCWPAPDRRRKCRCGCGGPATSIGACNGMALMSGCELSVRRWMRAAPVRAA